METIEKGLSFIKPPSKLRLIKRSIRFLYQRLTRGWDDSDTWNLDWTLSKMTLPRLIRLREIIVSTKCHPASFENLEEWLLILDDMIYFHYVIANSIEYGEADEERYKKGKQSFVEHYEKLWW